MPDPFVHLHLHSEYSLLDGAVRIPALMKKVNRTSQRTLYFESEKARDLAYMLLNSSVMYWWWRVRDGGMTLSLETLMSLPIPSCEIDNELIRSLKLSEDTNRVFKMNAGSLQENIKHDMKLVAMLNEAIAPTFAEKLLSTHENSDHSQLRFLPQTNSVTR
jgi:hypothetical protein